MGDGDIVKILLEKVTEVYGSDLTLGKALYAAVFHGHENVVKILCAACNQDDVNYIDPALGDPVISRAVKHGKKKFLK